MCSWLGSCCATKHLLFVPTILRPRVVKAQTVFWFQKLITYLSKKLSHVLENTNEMKFRCFEFPMEQLFFEKGQFSIFKVKNWLKNLLVCTGIDTWSKCKQVTSHPFWGTRDQFTACLVEFDRKPWFFRPKYDFRSVPNQTSFSTNFGLWNGNLTLFKENSAKCLYRQVLFCLCFHSTTVNLSVPIVENLKSGFQL